ncbi:MAG: peptidoglycan DD-metalloendopeptidase family protein [Steroidobacteraceae bacterium]|jgi:lipoprotein NlpD|nr:peptidoglycan DD-metalloendopeptidase family protein [Steroidobacteraceae bacterium]
MVPPIRAGLRAQARIALLLLVFAASLAACGGEPRRPPQPEHYTVQAGDTLYSIATRHGLDYRDVARWNGIGRDYRIHPGQRLRLRPPSGAQATVAAPGSAAPAAPAARAPAAAPPPPPWTWPVAGGRVAGALQQPSGGVGLRIDGEFGQPVLAAADGRVVYTGSGLRGYGQLVILSHERGWLSAYGHNSSVLVGESEQVRAGQRIATMGNGPLQQPMLYFEIRVDGRPVDPLTQLPRR